MNSLPDFAGLIGRMASKYVWWKTAAEAAALPDRVIAQVMDIGDYADIQLLANVVGEATLRKVLLHAEAGQFSPRSWCYWHYRLNLATADSLPAMPTRRFE